MKLIAYRVPGPEVVLRPAPLEREWMEATDQRFAYRCLPLNIANGHGWELSSPHGFSAVWDGRREIDGIRIEPDGDRVLIAALSHFGKGILTFHVPYLFRTEAGYDLMITGPVNRPKDAIAPLTGIVETDWSPYSFTMNWAFTRTGAAVRFEPDEPFCHVFPIARTLEEVEPELRPLSDDPALEAQHQAWQHSRTAFNRDLKQPGSPATVQKWQRLYFQGLDVAGQATTSRHRSRLRLPPFKKPGDGG